MAKEIEKEKKEVKKKSKAKDDKKETKKVVKKKNDEIVEAEETENTEKVLKPKYRLKKPYLNYNIRIFINLIAIIILAITLFYSITKTFYITDDETISYSENSKIDYQVYLKDNEFYNTPYLNKGMAYIASLIDKVNINFNYIFYSNKTNSLNISHKAVAKLVIASQDNDKVFYENEYELTGVKVEKIIEKKEYVLNETVTIDYGYFNNLANKFKSKYAVATNSYLEVYLQVDEEKNNEKQNLINESKTVLTIPLSHQEINIGLKENTVDQNKSIKSEAKIAIENEFLIYFDLAIIIVLLILIIRFIHKLRLINNKKSKYDLYIERILNGYDRIIVNVKTAPNFDDYNIIKVENFQELIDVRDNVKEPIQYYVITEHQKCEFFCTNHNDLYLYVVKSVDIDNN